MPIIDDVLKEIKEISPIEDVLATGLSSVLLTGPIGAWMLGSAFSVGDAGNLAEDAETLQSSSHPPLHIDFSSLGTWPESNNSTKSNGLIR